MAKVGAREESQIAKPMITGRLSDPERRVWSAEVEFQRAAAQTLYKITLISSIEHSNTLKSQQSHLQINLQILRKQ